MLRAAFQLFALRPQAWSDVQFPRWQAIAGLALSGGLLGFDPAMRAAPPDMAPMPLGLAVALGVLLILLTAPLMAGFLRRWMQRGGRWDGRGDMLHLLTASWLVGDVLAQALVVVGVPTLWVLPLWLYTLWVGVKALSAAIPRASLAYSFAGTAIGMLLMLVLSGFLLTLVDMALTGRSLV